VGFPQEAILVLTTALHNDVLVPDELSDDRALALKALADLEYRAGDKTAARRHIAAAYASIRKNVFFKMEGDHGVGADFKRISPSGLSSAQSDQASAFRRETAGLTPDERTIYAQMGWPDHVESFDSGGYHVETWWYGKDSYYASYTFTNGALTSTYDP
jgi:hypothetical protein